MKRITCVVILTIVAAGALVIWYSGGRTVTSPGENRTTTSRDGTTIAFTKRGSGPPLIIVDGAFCYRENGPATELAKVLAQHFTVFTYDRRGRGESADTAPYAVEREIDDLRTLTREAGVTPFAVGISSGGALLLQAAASGVGVKKMVLYEPPYLAGPNGPRSLEDARNRLQSFVSAGDRAGAVRFFMTDIYGAARVCVRDAIPDAKRMEEEQAGRSHSALRPDDSRRQVGAERKEFFDLRCSVDNRGREESQRTPRCGRSCGEGSSERARPIPLRPRSQHFQSRPRPGPVHVFRYALGSALAS